MVAQKSSRNFFKKIEQFSTDSISFMDNFLLGTNATTFLINIEAKDDDNSSVLMENKENLERKKSNDYR